MKITLRQAFLARRIAFPALLELELPLDLSLRLGAVIDRIEEESRRYDLKRNQRVKELGTVQPDGTFQLGANTSLFQDEIDKAEAVEIELSWKPIKPTDLGNARGRLVAIFAYARWLFQEDEKPKEESAVKAAAATIP